MPATVSEETATVFCRPSFSSVGHCCIAFFFACCGGKLSLSAAPHYVAPHREMGIPRLLQCGALVASLLPANPSAGWVIVIKTLFLFVCRHGMPRSRFLHVVIILSVVGAFRLMKAVSSTGADILSICGLRIVFSTLRVAHKRTPLWQQTEYQLSSCMRPPCRTTQRCVDSIFSPR